MQPDEAPRPDDPRNPPEEADDTPAAEFTPGSETNPYQAFPAEKFGPDAALVAKPVEELQRRGLPQPHFGWALLWVIALFVLQIVVSVVAAVVAVAVVVASGGTPDDLGKPETMGTLMRVMIPLATATTLLFAVGVAAVAFRGQMARCLAIRNLSGIQWALVLLLVIPLAIVASEIGNWAAEVLPSLELGIPPSFAQESLVLIFIAGCLLPGVGEEIFFRGFLSRGMIARHGVILGGLLTSLLFGVLHLNPPQIVGTFILGLGMQYLLLATKSLLAPIALHTLNNLGAFAVARVQEEVPIPGLNVVAEEGIVHTPLPLTAAAVVALTLLLVLLHQSRTRWKLPSGETWNPGFTATETPPPELDASPVSSAPNLALVVALPAAMALVSYLTYQAHVNFVAG